MSSNHEWIAMVQVEGGPGRWDDNITWRLDLVRSCGPHPDDHWWVTAPDEAADPRVQVFRDEDGRVCRLVIDGAGPLGRAVQEFGLDGNAFGSPTLWGGPPGVSGWVWTFSDVEDSFPFDRRSPHALADVAP